MVQANSIRICFVAPHAYPILDGGTDVRFAGGAELQQVLLAKGLAGRGFSVSMICLDYGQPDRQTIDGVVVYRAYRPDSGIPGLRFIWPRLTSVWRCMKAANADIYYQRAGGMLTGVVAAFCGRYGKRSVFAIAGDPKIRFRRDRWLYEYGVRNVDAIVAQHGDQQKQVRQRFACESVMVPNIMGDTSYGSGSGSGYVLWVGMIRQVKRPDIFLDIATSLPELKFVMVGGPSVGESDLYARVEAQAAGIGNLTFAGFVPYAQVDPYFDGAGIFVNTSDSEGFPNTFLQAWAREIPTVSFVDSGAVFEGAPVGVRVSSTEAMCEAISDLSRDPAGRRAKGARARRYVLETHSAPKVLERYERLFETLLRSRNGRADRNS